MVVSYEFTNLSCTSTVKKKGWKFKLRALIKLAPLMVIRKTLGINNLTPAQSMQV